MERWRTAVRRTHGPSPVDLQLIPVQVCPWCRDPGFTEAAVRDIRAVRRFTGLGRVRLVVRQDWISVVCPQCGRRLEQACPDDMCAAPIISAADSHCRRCGRPYPWIQGRDWRDHAEHIGRIANVDLWALNGDITTIVVDAVVVGDDLEGRMVGLVGQAVVRAGGAQIQQESVDKRQGGPGSSWVTSGGSLPCDHVVHVAVMSADGHTEPEWIRTATQQALITADQLNIQSLGLSALGAGRARLPADISGSEMGSAVVSYFERVPASRLRDLVFVLYGEEVFDLFVAGVRAGTSADPAESGRETYEHSDPNDASES
jgi:O-acetyl-ADP-ribose deacetylase (regulator of RNase III)